MPQSSGGEIATGPGIGAGDSPAGSPTKPLSRSVEFAVWFFLLSLLARTATSARTADLDMFHQMSLIRAWLVRGSLPRSDIFAYTQTVEPFVHHEWGAGVLLYAVVIGAGLGSAGALLLKYALIAGTAGFAYAAARLRGGAPGTIGLFAPLTMVMVAVGLATLRAQLYTFLGVAILLFCFELDRRGSRRWIPALLVAYVIWLNVHGGFVIGVVLTGAQLIERFWRRRGEGFRIALSREKALTAAFVAMLILPLVNPYGLAYIPYLWEALLLDRALIAEWAPVWDPRVGSLVRAALAASLLPVVYATVGSRGSERSGVLMLLVSGVAALGAQRMLPVYGIVWLCTVPAWLEGTRFAVLIRDEAARRGRWIVYGATIAGLACLFQAAASAPWVLRVPTVREPGAIHFPAGAVAYLSEADFKGNLMTPFDAGAFVTWHLHPSVLVGMDSRYEAAYPPGAIDDNVRLYTATGEWRRILEDPATDAVLVPVPSGLDEVLRESGTLGSSWTEVYRDDGFVVVARPDVAAGLPREDRTGEEVVASFP